MWSFYCNIGELKFENRESQAESQILCTKQFSFREFNAEIDNLNSIIQTRNSKVENGKTISMWSFYCKTQFSFRAWIVEIENLMLKIQNEKPKDENGKPISMRSFYCNIGKPRYGIRESQAGNQILCNKQFWFRVFIAEIENLK